jgi:hypothetical protein
MTGLCMTGASGVLGIGAMYAGIGGPDCGEGLRSGREAPGFARTGAGVVAGCADGLVVAVRETG